MEVKEGRLVKMIQSMQAVALTELVPSVQVVSLMLEVFFG